MKKVNLHTVELDEPLDEHGFRHVATSIGPRLGARQIGAGVYQAEAGAPIWPYHYHYGVEEWLYVLAGAPVLRDQARERTLAPGDLVCFPTGPRGTHTLKGPGRFVIFDAIREDEPYMSVYPDSDKLSVPEGMFLRSGAVGYWHGEGTAGARPPGPAREPEALPPQPVLHVLAASPGELAGSRLAATVICDGQPYHYVHGREAWLLVLDGTPVLRHPEGEERLAPGDVVCLPEGPAGARGLRGPGRVLSLSTTGLPANVCYPDTGQWVMLNGPGPAYSPAAWT